MKKQRYIVEIEMPDGDFISAGWLKALIQTDCDVKDEGRQKVTVQETFLSSNLDDAADKNALIAKPDLWDATDSGTATPLFYMSSLRAAFKAGAEWREQQIPKLPDNLDKAAEKCAKENCENYVDEEDGVTYIEEALRNTFKAGAKWMAGQGYTKEETVYFERLCDENRIMVDLGWGEPERGGFNPGDKVVVQIRKAK